MIREEGAFQSQELVRRSLAAEDRAKRLREVYGAYHDYDWRTALLADLMLTYMQFAGARDDGLEWDMVIAEGVAGVQVQGGLLASIRKRWNRRRFLRDRQEEMFFDYGRWTA